MENRRKLYNYHQKTYQITPTTTAHEEKKEIAENYSK